MTDLIRLLIERLDKIRDDGDEKQRDSKRRDFIRNLALREARFNLDLIAVWNLKGVSERAEERLKVLQCLRLSTSELLRTAGILPEEIFEGGAPRAAGNILESADRELDSKQLSEIELFEFSTRKIQVLRDLATQGFDVEGLLKSQIRIDNISAQLRELISKIQLN